MRKFIALVFATLLFAAVAPAQRSAPASKAELAEITERGKRLAEYDVAAWHATDAVVAAKPTEGSVARYIAQKIDGGWTVVFGRLNDKRDKFLIAYEAKQATSPTEFTVKKYESPKEDADFFLVAAKAMETALADFKGENRPYNIAVLPALSGHVYVYVIPAQTENGIFPLGADARYLFSPDGAKIVEKRRLHISIIEFKTPPDSQKVEGGFHTAILDDVPEDTDVFHVLSRKPSVPEWVGTKKYMYRIETDGTINYLMTMEAFLKIGK
jgi:hypothetical protein